MMKNTSRFPSVRQMIVESALGALNEEEDIGVGTNHFPASRLMSDEDINAQHHNWWFSEIQKETSRGLRGSPRVDVVAVIEFPDADGETFDESRTLWFVGDEDGDYEDFRDQNDVWLSPDIRGEVLAVLNYVRYNWSNGERKMFNTPEAFEPWKQFILSAEDEKNDY